MTITRSLPAAAVLWTVLSTGCLFQTDGPLAGGGIRTTNGEVAGRIRFEDATPAEGVTITLTSIFLSASGLDKSRVHTGVTDSAGRYSFPDIPKGRYVLTVSDGIAGTLAVHSGLVKTDSGLAVLDVLLTPRIVLRGRILPPADEGPLDPSRYRICLPGLPDCVQPGADSVYVFPKAPQGRYDVIILRDGISNYLTFYQVGRGETDTVEVKDVRFRASWPDTSQDYALYPTDLQRSFHVLPTLYKPDSAPAWYAGKSFDAITYSWLSWRKEIQRWHIEDYLEWKHRQAIPLRTGLLSASAAPQGLDFPYLVRLNSDNFDFTLARPRGEDIRFSSEDNRRLDYYISTWDPTSHTAEIWVRLDTLYGSNAPRSVWLHAGKEGVGSQSFSYTGLNREAGYANEMHKLTRSIWMMDDLAANAKVGDQSGKYPGTFRRLGQANANTSAKSAAGLIGRALGLDGTADYIAIDGHDTLDYPVMTFMLWAKNVSDLPAQRQFLAAKGTAAKRQWQLSVDAQGHLEFAVGDASGRIGRSWRSVQPRAAFDSWHHYAVTFGAGEAKVYVDGVEIPMSVAGEGPQAIPATAGGIALGINMERTGGLWSGALDHVTYDRQVCKPDWIRLTFESQRL